MTAQEFGRVCGAAAANAIIVWSLFIGGFFFLQWLGISKELAAICACGIVLSTRWSVSIGVKDNYKKD